MWIRKAANFIDKGLSPLIPFVGGIGAGIIALMMLLTVGDVAGRRIFNRPVPGAYELGSYMLVIVTFSSIVYCQFLRGHVRIDLVVSRLRQRTQDVINSIMYVFFLVAFCLLTWRLCLYAMGDWRAGIISGVLEVPTFPFIFVAALGCALLSLVVLMHFLLFLAESLKK